MSRLIRSSYVSRRVVTRAWPSFTNTIYVVAGDVYSCGSNAGRSGWTWYTGAAAWMYTVYLEDILGIKLQGGKLSFEPCLPPGWDKVSVELYHGESLYKIELFNPEGRGTGAGFWLQCPCPPD